MTLKSLVNIIVFFLVLLLIEYLVTHNLLGEGVVVGMAYIFLLWGTKNGNQQ